MKPLTRRFHAPAASNFPSRATVVHFLKLTKPRLTLLALATTSVGFYLGSPAPFDFDRFWHTLLGSLAVGAGANTLNQYLERDSDARMKRTAKRPLPAKELRPEDALIFGVLLSVAGVLHLAFWVNFLVAVLGTAVLLTYLYCYTPLKKVSPISTVVGSIPGALPPVMGWAAATGHVSGGAWALFLILALWQIPHFYAIGWVCRADYASAGLPVLTVSDKSGKKTAAHILVSTALLFVATLIPTFIGVTGTIYLSTAVLLGFLFAGLALAQGGEKPMEHARPFFIFSIIYLFLLLIVMIMDRV